MAKQVTSKKKGRAVATREVKLPANWREQLAEDAREEAERTPTGSGNNITLRKNGQFSFQGADLGDSIDVVIIDHCLVKKWYDKEYDEDNPSPPACFALKLDAKNIAPHESSPNQQAKICSECWANEWASGRKRGKACADKHRVAMLHVDDISGDADLVLMEVPVTSGRKFDSYVSKLSKATSTPSYAVVTRISMDPDADWQSLIFEFKEKLPDQLAFVAKSRKKEARETLLTPFDVSGYQKGGKEKSSKKTPQKRSRLSR